MRFKIDEDALQVFTKELLDLRSVPGIVYFHVANENSESVQVRVKLKKRGVRKGVADWCILLPGRTAFLELKRPKDGKQRAGKQSDAQKQFEADVTALGHTYMVARTPQEIESVLVTLGAITSHMRAAA
jgi:hypothetical protein